MPQETDGLIIDKFSDLFQKGGSMLPAWWILFLANKWFGANALYQVPSHGVGTVVQMLHRVVNVAQRLSC